MPVTKSEISLENSGVIDFSTSTNSVETPLIISVPAGKQLFLDVILFGNDSTGAVRAFRYTRYSYYNDGTLTQSSNNGSAGTNGATITTAVAISGTDVEVRATGEALTDVNWKLKYEYFVI